MMTKMMALFAAGAAAPACAAKCPPHAIAALVAALVIGLVIGYLLGRRGGKKGATCTCADKKAAAQPQQTFHREPRRAREPRESEMRQPIPVGSVEIYVGNLSYDLTEEQLRKTFEAFGKVDTARVVMNKFNDKSKGFGFVVMPNRAEAEAAIAAMSEKEVLGRKMRVNEARNTIKAEA